MILVLAVRVRSIKSVMGLKISRVVYFAGAIRGDRVVAETIKELIFWIKSQDIQVLTEHIADDSVSDKDSSAIEIEKRDIAWLDQATHVVAEISGASTGTGREIEYARTKEKFGKTPAKVLCLYQIEREFYASPMIRGMTSDRYPNVVVKSYSKIEEAKDIVQNFLQIDEK